MGTRDRVTLNEKVDKERVGQPAVSLLYSFPDIYINKVYISSVEMRGRHPSIGLHVPGITKARRRLTTYHFLHSMSPPGAELPTGTLPMLA